MGRTLAFRWGTATGLGTDQVLQPRCELGLEEMANGGPGPETHRRIFSFSLMRVKRQRH